MAEAGTRVLCLGNELMADDSFALRVAARLRKSPLPGVEVVSTENVGFHLLDHILNVSRLIVVDTLITGKAKPGTIYQLRADDLAAASGTFPHALGLLEILALARKLGLQTPNQVVLLAVEPADCLTVGGAMHPAVKAAVPRVVRLVREYSD